VAWNALPSWKFKVNQYHIGAKIQGLLSFPPILGEIRKLKLLQFGFKPAMPANGEEFSIKWQNSISK